MKTYVLTVSRNFPKTHKRHGELTHFVEKILVGQYDKNENFYLQDTKAEFDREIFFECRNPKIHTIRTNYKFWSKRIAEIQNGNAVLSVRYWSGKPYNSKQVEICQLDKDSGCGVQELEFFNSNLSDPVVMSSTNNPHLTREQLAKNDGLSLEEFKEWFKGYDLSQPMAIIHFTSFRY